MPKRFSSLWTFQMSFHNNIFCLIWTVLSSLYICPTEFLKYGLNNVFLSLLSHEIIGKTHLPKFHFEFQYWSLLALAAIPKNGDVNHLHKEISEVCQAVLRCCSKKKCHVSHMTVHQVSMEMPKSAVTVVATWGLLQTCVDLHRLVC